MSHAPSNAPERNASGQPIGAALPHWQPPPAPPRTPMIGRFCRLEPMNDDRFAAELYDANRGDRDGRHWTYLPYGPFTSEAEFGAWTMTTCVGPDPLFHAIVDLASGRAVGAAAYLRITPAVGAIEVGHLNFTPRLQRTAAATEAMYLMMARAFALGYRRYEWKCDALNAPSRAAAERLGFTFEGIFRQAVVYKGRNRDTAWFSVIDSEWPALDAAFTRWLSPDNFGEDGRQRASLAEMRRRVRAETR